jgi:hypothetical protein
MQADPDTLAKKILGMPGEKPAEDPLADEVDVEGEAIEAAAEDAAEEMGMPGKGPALAAFGRAIARIVRGAD